MFVSFNTLIDPQFEQRGFHSCSPVVGMCSFNDPVAAVVYCMSRW